MHDSCMICTYQEFEFFAQNFVHDIPRYLFSDGSNYRAQQQMGVGVSRFRTKLFENLQSYPYTVSDKSRHPIYSPEILVSRKVSFMRIFAGVRWRNESGVVTRSLYLPNFHIQGHNYYIVLCSRP